MGSCGTVRLQEAWDRSGTHKREWESLWDARICSGLCVWCPNSDGFSLVLFAGRHKLEGGGSEGGESWFCAVAGRRCQDDGREVTGLAGEDGKVTVGKGCRWPVSGCGESGKATDEEETRW